MKKSYLSDLLSVGVVVVIMAFIAIRFVNAQDTHDELDMRACMLDMRKQYLDLYMDYVGIVEDYFQIWSDVIPEYEDVVSNLTEMRIAYYDIFSGFDYTCVPYEWVAEHGVSDQVLDEYSLALDKLYDSIPGVKHYVNIHKNALAKIDHELDNMGLALLAYAQKLEYIQSETIPDENMTIGGTLDFNDILDLVKTGRFDFGELMNLSLAMFNDASDNISKLQDLTDKVTESQ